MKAICHRYYCKTGVGALMIEGNSPKASPPMVMGSRRNSQHQVTNLEPAGTKEYFFPVNGLRRNLLVACLLSASFALRLFGIADPLLDVHPTRQYRSALLARAMYFASSDSVPEDVREAASAARPAILEVPVMEYMTSRLYQIAGRESFLIPRLLSVTCWTVGGLLLYLLSRRLLSPDASIVSTAFFLFVPFGVSASRSFQPDPLMVMLFLASALSILKYYKVPSSGALAAAIGLSASAVLVKPVCIFPIWLAFLSAGITKHGCRSFLRKIQTLAFFCLSLLPTLLFYGYGVLVAGSLRDQAQGSFVPLLVLEVAYWKGWLRLALQVIGHGALFTSLLGVLLADSGLTRNFLLALWGGYAALGLVFTYHIHTHAYYHLLLVPIAALSLGVTAAVVLGPITSTPKPARAAAYALLASILFLYAWESRSNLVAPNSDLQVQLWEEIGDQVDHSANTVFLARHYGNPLRYHARIAGSHWPNHGDFEAAELVGKKMRRGRELLKFLLLEKSPEYFVVTDVDELHRQRDLKEALAIYPVVVSNEDYRIYDLSRAGKEDDPPDRSSGTPTE